jgi:hypothetical protein
MLLRGIQRLLQKVTGSNGLMVFIIEGRRCARDFQIDAYNAVVLFHQLVRLGRAPGRTSDCGCAVPRHGQVVPLITVVLAR